MHEPVIHVAAGVIVNPEGKILVAKRPEHTHQGGLWEFPGGKLETAEPVEEALKRELYEEVGIEVQQARPLIRIHHDYPDKSVLLDVWKVTSFTGTAHGKEGQPVKWLEVSELNLLDFPDANRPIITASQLPASYMITPVYSSLDEAVLHVSKRIEQGIRLIQFRAHYLVDEDYLVWADKLAELCQSFQTFLILNRDVQLVNNIQADGIHLTSARLIACKEKPVINGKWLSASVHNKVELEKANDLGVDFIVVSPVLATESHPEAEPLGWPAFYQLTEKANMPVYALGGMTLSELEKSYQYGAQGIAAIRGLFNA